jgi:hypothetical protein
MEIDTSAIMTISSLSALLLTIVGLLIRDWIIARRQ